MLDFAREPDFILAASACAFTGWLLWRMSYGTPKELKRSTRSIPLSYGGTKKLREMLPNGGRYVYQDGDPVWNPVGIDQNSPLNTGIY